MWTVKDRGHAELEAQQGASAANAGSSTLTYKIVDFGLQPVIRFPLPATQTAAMGYPRHHLVPPGAPGLYHCYSRCVRRAYLCGEDPVSGQSFEHRKSWVEDRLLLLANCFSVSLHAFAVMSNHLHVVIQLLPQAADDWSAEEVAERWLRVSGNRQFVGEPQATSIRAIVRDPDRVETLRDRLGSLSWFMARLNEPIARWANQEDGCTGRFWEGRFESVALLDDAAVLSCMVYVDLNPVAAGICSDPADAPHTSIRHRLRNDPLEEYLWPVAGLATLPQPTMRLSGYLLLLRWTAEIRSKREGAFADPPYAALVAAGIRPESWGRQIEGLRRHYRRAVGSVEAMAGRADSLGQKWLVGVGFARTLAD